MSTRSVNIGQDPRFTRELATKFHRLCKFILKDLMSHEFGAIPSNQRSASIPNRRQEDKIINSIRAEIP
jgi:hypothetical protein